MSRNRSAGRSLNTFPVIKGTPLPRKAEPKPHSPSDKDKKKWPDAQASCGEPKGPLETWLPLIGTHIRRRKDQSFDAVGPAADAWDRIRDEIEGLFAGKQDTVTVSFRMVGKDKQSAVPALLIFSGDEETAKEYRGVVEGTGVWRGFVGRYPVVRVMCFFDYKRRLVGGSLYTR